MIKEHPHSVLLHQPVVESAEVTVCISLYNYPQYIIETLESVQSQTLQTLDLIVVDDRSTDDSLVLAGEWIQQNAERFNGIKLIRHEQNQGLSITRNTAILQAETPYIFILDADNLLYPRCIERCLDALTFDANAAVAYPIIEKFGDEQALMGNVVWERSQFLQENRIDAMSLIRRSALLQVDGYSYLEAIGPLGWEDYDLWCKFVDMNFYGVQIPEVLAKYQVHADSMLNSISNKKDNIKLLHQEMTSSHPWLDFEKQEKYGEQPKIITDKFASVEEIKSIFIEDLKVEKNIETPVLDSSSEISYRNKYSERIKALFDESYYIDQLGDHRICLPDEINLIHHYLSIGWKQGLNPHPLFHTNYYLNHNSLTSNMIENPLVHYIESGGEADPHYLFSTSGYLKAVEVKPVQETPLEHFLNLPFDTEISPSFWFDPDYYRTQIIDKYNNLDILKDNHLLTSYLKTGWKMNLNPSRFFNCAFYKKQIESQKTDPLYHYLGLKGYETLSPHPGFDLDYFCRQVDNFQPKDLPSIQHFIELPGDRPSPSPAFNQQFYLKSYEDIEKWDLCPSLHFLQYGYWEEFRTINSFFSAEYILKSTPHESFKELSAQQYYLSHRCYRKRRILFVGHEASRTGAPLILLRLIQDISTLGNVESFLILGKDGDILDDYKACCHTYVLQNIEETKFLDTAEEHSSKFKSEIQEILSNFAANPVEFAICNTAQVRHIGDLLFQSGIPIYSLVHEMADPYLSKQWKSIYDQSNKVIFPSKAVLNRAEKKIPTPLEKCEVIGQGLLRDNFGKYGRIQARKNVLEELDLEDNVFMVLGCGTMDFRKGIDLFIGTARKLIQTTQNLKNIPKVKFVWVGQEVPEYGGPSYWAFQEAQRDGLDQIFIHVPATSAVEQYFMAADLFLMTSRADPFPCVVHEAMASSLPVIYFDGAGGASELVQESAGIPVPYGDTTEMADAVQTLLIDRDKCRQLGKKGEKIIREEYQFSQYTQKLLDLIVEDLSLKTKSFGELRNLKQVSTKTIYFLATDWWISGVNTFTKHLIKQLNILGFDAKLLFTNGRHADLPEDPMLMPDVPYMFLQPMGDHVYEHQVWLTLIEFFRYHDPCIIVPNYDYVGSAISPLLPSQVGVVGIAHSDDVEHYEHVYRLGRWWNRIVAVSDFIRCEIVSQNQSFEQITSTIRYGVPVEQKLTTFDLQKKTHFSDRPIRLLYSGRIVYHQKRVERYVELVKLLAEERVNFELTMMGDGEAYEWLQMEMDVYIKQGMVHLPGRVSPSDISEALKKTDIFILLSDFEGLPLSLLEAMIYGCIPVVTNMKSGIPEVITNGENGFICSKQDLRMAVVRIKQIASDRNLRFKLSQNVLKSFKELKLRDVDMAKSYAEIFEEVFEEIEQGKYVRPESFGYKSSIHGVIPPIWLK